MKTQSVVLSSAVGVHVAPQSKNGRTATSTGRALMVMDKDLGQCDSVTLVSCSLEAVLPVLFKCCGSTVGQYRDL